MVRVSAAFRCFWNWDRGRLRSRQSRRASDSSKVYETRVMWWGRERAGAWGEDQETRKVWITDNFKARRSRALWSCAGYGCV